MSETEDKYTVQTLLFSIFFFVFAIEQKGIMLQFEKKYDVTTRKLVYIKRNMMFQHEN